MSGRRMKTDRQKNRTEEDVQGWASGQEQKETGGPAGMINRDGYLKETEGNKGIVRNDKQKRTG